MSYTYNGDRKLIAGVGSALVDMLIYENDEFIEKTGAAKGGMTLVDSEFIEKTLVASQNEPEVVPGGSCCNTIIGAGKLGGPARFVGKRGQDYLGDLLEKDLKKNNVEPQLMTSATATGRVLSIITSDAQRTMFTYLGASSESTPEEITEKSFEGAAVVHIEGYLLFNRDLILAAFKAAKAAGALVSLDLASFQVVEQSKEYIEEFVRDYVDILIANEDEARAFTGFKDEAKALDALAAKADIAVLKVGKRGSFIACGGEIIKVDPLGDGTAIDTTGAGDLWASGFLYGYVNGLPLDKCGALGSACGFEVCQVVGANIPEDGWERISVFLD